MKKFLKKISFFIAIIFIGWLILELFYRNVPNNYSQKDKDVVQNYDDAQILIFGNSHSFYGLNPDFFSKRAYNLSNISQTLMYDKLLFDKHEDKFENLKYVVLNVEYSSLSQDDNMPEIQWRKYFYEAQMGVETGTVSNFDVKKYSLALVPRLAITISSLKEYIQKGSIVECISNGWAGKVGVNEAYNNPRMGKVIARKHEDGSTDFYKNTQRIKSIIAKCREKNIKVVLVTMPVTSYYADNVNKDKLQLIFKQCHNLDKLYNVSYINLFFDKRFTNKDFYDTDHLNTGGAQKCSQIISDFIDKKSNLYSRSPR
jgi:hypothetical protein